MKHTLIALAALSLVACGGGGSSEPDPIKVHVVNPPAINVPAPPTFTPPPPIVVSPLAAPPPRVGDLVVPAAQAPIPPAPAPAPVVQEPIRPAQEPPLAAPRPEAPTPTAPVCPARPYATPEAARAAAPRNEMGQIIAPPDCLTRPDPMTAAQLDIDIWNAICGTARCLVTAGRLP